MNEIVSISLERLADQLKTEGLPSQTVIAKGAQVDQSLVSRARAGRLCRVTPPVIRLAEYVQARIDNMQIASSRSPGADVDLIAQAESSVRTYLTDGFDARLLLEQVAVLRRAQSRTARKGGRASRNV